MSIIKIPQQPPSPALIQLRNLIDWNREKLWIKYPDLITLINSQLGLTIKDIGELNVVQANRVLDILRKRKGDKKR